MPQLNDHDPANTRTITRSKLGLTRETRIFRSGHYLPKSIHRGGLGLDFLSFFPATIIYVRMSRTIIKRTLNCLSNYHIRASPAETRSSSNNQKMPL